MLIQPLRGDYAAMFCGTYHVPEAGMFRGVYRNQLCRQHLHTGNPQQTPVQHESVQGYRNQGEEHDGVVCGLQAASSLQRERGADYIDSVELI